MTNLTTANTILNQLGGRRFLAMTGSTNLVGGKNSLSMKLKRNSSKCNYLRITLNSMDTYDVEFISIIGTKISTKKQFTNIYNDQLVNIFENETGYYTSL